MATALQQAGRRTPPQGDETDPTPGRCTHLGHSLGTLPSRCPRPLYSTLDPLPPDPVPAPAWRTLACSCLLSGPWAENGPVLDKHTRRGKKTPA